VCGCVGGSHILVGEDPVPQTWVGAGSKRVPPRAASAALQQQPPCKLGWLECVGVSPCSNRCVLRCEVDTCTPGAAGTQHPDGGCVLESNVYICTWCGGGCLCVASCKLGWECGPLATRPPTSFTFRWGSRAAHVSARGGALF
jgi:hypothetical protein